MPLYFVGDASASAVRWDKHHAVADQSARLGVLTI
jgi:hypothetical protein